MDSIIQTLDETGVPWEPLLLVVLVVLYVLVLDQIVQAILRLTVGRQYSVRIPFSVRVGVDLHPDDVGSFAMGYPQWRSAKKDGTRDRRTNDFHVIKDRTLILLDGWKLRGKNPFEAYDLVRALRRNGQVIVPCQEERLKRSRLASHAMRRRDCGNIDDIISAFEDRPTDFEDFCADMFRTLGWMSETTPPTNDGGYDISMRGETGATAIVECKCYARNHHVGTARRAEAPRRERHGRSPGDDGRDHQLLHPGRSRLCGPDRRAPHRRHAAAVAMPARMAVPILPAVVLHGRGMAHRRRHHGTHPHGSTGPIPVISTLGPRRKKDEPI